MRKPKLHNRFGRSIATLPFSALFALTLWWLPQGGYSHSYLVSLLLTGLTAYVLIETNNSNALFRTRSRMMSSFWLLAMGCIGLLHPFQPAMIATFCLSVSYYLLFKNYQQTQNTAEIFHVFVMLSVGAVAYPSLICYAPFFLWYLLVFMRAISFRGLLAALIGLICPFWFWIGYLLWQEDMQPLVDWWAALPHFSSLPCLSEMTLSSPLHLSWLVVGFLAVWSSVYYLQHSYDDKIKVRMILYVYVCQSILTLLFVVFQPQHLLPMLPIMLLNCSPLVAHYITLRATWVALVIFCLSVLAFVTLGVLTLL